MGVSEYVRRTKEEQWRGRGGKKEGIMGKLNHVCIRMGEGEKAKTGEVSDESPSSSQLDGLWAMHGEV